MFLNMFFVIAISAYFYSFHLLAKNPFFFSNMCLFTIIVLSLIWEKFYSLLGSFQVLKIFVNNVWCGVCHHTQTTRLALLD
jgi:hypothetical protein